MYLIYNNSNNYVLPVAWLEMIVFDRIFVQPGLILAIYKAHVDLSFCATYRGFQVKQKGDPDPREFLDRLGA